MEPNWLPHGFIRCHHPTDSIQLDGRTQTDSQFANANSDDPSASIYAVQIALSVYQKEQLLAESYYHSDDNTSRNGAYLQHLSVY